MTDLEWARIGWGLRAQGRVLRIAEVRGTDGTPFVLLHTPLRKRKRPNKHALAVLASGRIWDRLK